MAYELYIPSQVQAWLGELREQDPAQAAKVDAALKSLRADGPAVGPPLVVPVDPRPGNGGGLPYELDYVYQAQTEALSRVRREAAEAAMLRKTLEGHLEADAPLTDDQRDRLRAACDGIRAQEVKLTQTSQRMIKDVDAFRVRKEMLKASCTQALADGIALLVDASLVSGHEDIEPPQLMELRPGAPDAVLACLLFAVETPEFIRIIAAATTDDLLRAWYREVVPEVYPEFGLRVTARARASATPN